MPEQTLEVAPSTIYPNMGPVEYDTDTDTDTEVGGRLGP